MKTCTPGGCGKATAVNPSPREQFASRRFVLAAVGSGGTPEPLGGSERRPERPRHPLKGLRILVVDDEADERELLSLLLASQGAQVLTAASAAEAWNLLREPAVELDVLLTDLAMPGEDGLSLVRRLRAHPELGSLPAVALTAFQSEEHRESTRQAGFQAHLGKPVDHEQLVSVLRRYTSAG